MRIPLSWLKKYFPTAHSPEKIAETLTLAGVEVDQIIPITPSFENVVVAKILDVKPHPEADRLKIASVTDGVETYQVVCGAPNCRQGLHTAFAKIGAKLGLNSEEKPLTIKKSKLRGIPSEGMLCGAEELDLEESSDGIMELTEDFSLGTPLSSFFEDLVFDVTLTPNLGHCQSIRGIARELCAFFNETLASPYSYEETKAAKKPPVTVSVETTDCFRYACRALENVKVGPSPTWMVEALTKAGMRSINNVVDVTNFVMMDLGQPMHAFDLDKLSSKTLRVALASSDTQIKTLDQEERIAPKGALMIYEENTPIAVAGVMGGASSEVSEQTQTVLLEAAAFCPSSVRSTSKKMNLRSDSSSRFERGVDTQAVIEALDLATKLLIEHAGASVLGETVDVEKKAFSFKTIQLRTSFVNRLLGTHLSQGEILSLLQRLRFQISAKNEELIDVIPPSDRNDVVAEIDLIEEIARLYGFQNIPQHLPVYRNPMLKTHPMHLMEEKAREAGLQMGLQEFITCDLISPKLSNLEIDPQSSVEAISVLHPSSVDQSILRTSLMPGMLEAIKMNEDVGSSNIQAFEIGNIHFRREEKLYEHLTFGLILSGSQPHSWSQKARDVDFFDLKGLTEAFFHAFSVTTLEFRPSSLNMFHPGQQGQIFCENRCVGALGQIHPKISRELDLKKPIFYAQIDLQLLESMLPSFITQQPLPQFPGSTRDLTMTISRLTEASAIFAKIDSLPSKLLKKSEIVDLYRDEKLGEDKQNISLRFLYRDDQKTLKQESVDREHERISKTLLENFAL